MKVKVVNQRSHSQEENVAELVGATSNEYTTQSDTCTYNARIVRAKSEARPTGKMACMVGLMKGTTKTVF